MKSPIVLSSLKELKEYRNAIQPSLRVGFVPTMGALHQGHATLLEQARKECDLVILSIFVNPTQFAPHEDLAKYPRPFEKDVNLAREHGVDAIFHPSVQEIYPDGYSTFVDETELSTPMCGQFRPGHFRGVATIVFRLFHWVKPTDAYFGLKDAQQFLIIRKMIQDLDLPYRLHGVPTVRESSGLALSSRNQYLSEDEKTIAPQIYKTLKLAEARIKKNESPSEVCLWAKEVLSQDFKVQYLDLREANHLKEVEHYQKEKTYVLAFAGFLGSTRLIDNVWIHPGSGPFDTVFEK